MHCTTRYELLTVAGGVATVPQPKQSPPSEIHAGRLAGPGPATPSSLSTQSAATVTTWAAAARTVITPQDNYSNSR